MSLSACATPGGGPIGVASRQPVLLAPSAAGRCCDEGIMAGLFGARASRSATSCMNPLGSAAIMSRIASGWHPSVGLALPSLMHMVDPFCVAHGNERRFGRRDFGLQLFDFLLQRSEFIFVGHLNYSA